MNTHTSFKRENLAPLALIVIGQEGFPSRPHAAGFLGILFNGLLLERFTQNMYFV